MKPEPTKPNLSYLIPDWQQNLFNYMHDQHNVILLQSEMYEIRDIVVNKGQITRDHIVAILRQFGVYNNISPKKTREWIKEKLK